MDEEQTYESEEKIVKFYGRLHLKKKLQQIDLSWKRQYLIQAALIGALLAGLLLCAVLFYYIFVPAPVKTSLPVADLHQLFDSNFSPYPIANVRGTDSEDNSLTEAYKAYDNKNFGESIALFEALEQTNSSVQLYYSNALLANGDFVKAIPILRQLSESTIKASANQGKWYLALALLHQNKLDDATTILSTLSANSNFYQQQAKELLQVLASKEGTK